MRKTILLFVLSMVFLSPCFSQNMLILGGEYSLFSPEFWGAGVGFNLKLFNKYIQNDVLITFGSIDAPPAKFLFSLRDSFYFCLEGTWLGLRAGICALLGMYGTHDLLFSPAGFVGFVLLPQSLISINLDACPGYAIAFRVGEDLGINKAGFSLALFFGVRLNLDKL